MVKSSYRSIAAPAVALLAAITLVAPVGVGLTGPRPARAAAPAQIPMPVSGETINVNLDPQMTPALVVKAPVPKGVSASSIEGDLIERYNTILVANQSLGRYIMPSDVVVVSLSVVTAANKTALATAAPTTKKGKKPAPPKKVTPIAPNANGIYTIYVMGRKLLVVDPATASMSTNGAYNSRDLAVKWAKQLQQHLPRVCFRPPSLPEYAPPANPALRVTGRIADADDGTIPGEVGLWGKTLFKIKGVQSDGQTGPDRALMLSRRVVRVVGRPGKRAESEVQAQVNPATPNVANVVVGTDVLFTLSAADARANSAPTAATLAAQVVSQMRQRMIATATTASVDATAAPVVPTSAAPSVTVKP